MISFSEGDASWGCRDFGRFQTLLWNLAGFNGCLHDAKINGDFLDAEEHPLFSFWDQEDSGVLDYSELEEFLKSLRYLLRKLPADHPDLEEGKRLIAAVKKAIKTESDLYWGEEWG